MYFSSLFFPRNKLKLWTMVISFERPIYQADIGNGQKVVNNILLSVIKNHIDKKNVLSIVLFGKSNYY